MTGSVPSLSCCEQEEPTYFAIWGDNKAFNEVIISPAMLHEHLPYVVMEGLNKVSVARPLGRWAPRVGVALRRSSHHTSISPSQGGGEDTPGLSSQAAEPPCAQQARGQGQPRTPSRRGGHGGRCSLAARHEAGPGCASLQVLENYNKGKTALLSAAKVMVSPTEVDLTPELVFQQQPLPTGPPPPAGLALELPAAEQRNSSVR